MNILKKIKDYIGGSDVPRRRTQFLLIFIFLILAAGIIFAGYLYYINFERNHLVAIKNELISITKLKTGEIVQWRKERIGDGSVFSHNLNFSIRLKNLIEKPYDDDAKIKLMTWLIKVHSAYQYDRLFIYDITGKELISFPVKKEAISPYIKRDISKIFKDGKVEFLDFHRDSPGQPIHLSVIVPIYDEVKNNEPLGVLLLRINPENYLYPLIKNWPVPSETAETLLVRREGNEVVFLNDLRFRKDAALSLRVPITHQNLPAARAAIGKQGVFSGQDYRGISVLSIMQHIPNSPWYFITKIDTDEVYGPIHARLWAVIFFIFALLGGAGGLLGFIWHQQTTSFYKEKIKAAEAVKESEARYRLLADHMSDTVWLMDLNLKTIYASPSVKKFRGYTPDEIKELPLEKHLTTESFERGMAIFQKEMEKIRKNPSYSFIKTLELEFYRKDGSTVWSENKFSLIRDENGKPISILGEGRDITERRHSEEALRYSEEKFRKAFFTSPDAIALTRINDGVYLSINEGFTQITGYTEEEVVGRSSLELNIWKNPEDRKKIVKTLLSGNDVRDFESTFITKRGEIRGMLSAAILELRNEKLILTITRDISERKIVEEKIKTSERFLNSIIDQSPYPMWISDNKGTLTRINKACLDLLQIKEDEVVGKYNIFHDNIVKEQGYISLIRKVFNKGETVNFELIYDSSELQSLDLEKTISVILDVTIFPIRDAAGEIKNAVIQHRDITQRKAAEVALRESEERVRAKLDAILSPEGDIGELELADIIDVPAIQKIMDDFYRLTHIGVGIINIKGDVLVGTGWQDICTKYHRINPETCRYCIESDTILSKGVEQGTYKMYKCKNKVWDIATPITVGGKHLGNLFLGQFLFDDDSLDEEFFRAQAKQYGFDEKEYIAAYKSMPRWSHETVDAVMNFYMKFADMFSKLSYSNIKLTRTLTERDRFMISLQESEERYRSLVEHAPDAIFVNFEGRVGLVNEACLNLFGAEKPEEILGKSPFELFHPDFHELIRERIRFMEKKGEPSPPTEEKIIRLDGTVVDVEVSASPFSWGGTNAIHIILRDITDRKIAEAELNKLYAEMEQRVIDRTAQLEAANKELEAFSYSVSHDLRAPLRHMSGFVDLLEKRFSELLPEKGRHYINNIADSTRQMGMLIDDLLAFSRSGRAEIRQEDLDMNIILKDVIDHLKHDTDNRKIEWIIPVLPESYGDQSMLKLVWTNLLTNALKFTRKRKQARIEIGAEEKKEEIVYFVRDNGVGFDMRYANKLFGVFQRLHSTEDFEGTGVGLANVRRIVARHGGQTWAKAKLRKGAAFYFSMPKRKEKNND